MDDFPLRLESVLGKLYFQTDVSSRDAERQRHP